VSYSCPKLGDLRFLGVHPIQVISAVRRWFNLQFGKSMIQNILEKKETKSIFVEIMIV
jgi:hypothetical protein